MMNPNGMKEDLNHNNYHLPPSNGFNIQMEEIVIISLIMFLWMSFIMLFIKKWGRIRSIEPYGPHLIRLTSSASSLPTLNNKNQQQQSRRTSQVPRSRSTLGLFQPVLTSGKNGRSAQIYGDSNEVLVIENSPLVTGNNCLDIHYMNPFDAISCDQEKQVSGTGRRKVSSEGNEAISKSALLHQDRRAQSNESHDEKTRRPSSPLLLSSIPPTCFDSYFSGIVTKEVKSGLQAARRSFFQEATTRGYPCPTGATLISVNLSQKKMEAEPLASHYPSVVICKDSAPSDPDPDAPLNPPPTTKKINEIPAESNKKTGESDAGMLKMKKQHLLFASDETSRDPLPHCQDSGSSRHQDHPLGQNNGNHHQAPLVSQIEGNQSDQDRVVTNDSLDDQISTVRAGFKIGTNS